MKFTDSVSLGLILAIFAILSGCGEDSSPTSISSTPTGTDQLPLAHSFEDGFDLSSGTISSSSGDFSAASIDGNAMIYAIVPAQMEDRSRSNFSSISKRDLAGPETMKVVEGHYYAVRSKEADFGKIFLTAVEDSSLTFDYWYPVPFRDTSKPPPSGGGGGGGYPY